MRRDPLHDIGQFLAQAGWFATFYESRMTATQLSAG